METVLHKFGAASCPADVYLSMNELNAEMLRAAMEALDLPEGEATTRLKEKRLFPVRKPSKGFGRLVVYQYIKRAPAHANSKITTTAVSTFLKRLNHYSGQGHWQASGSSATRKELVLSATESTQLLAGSNFVLAGLSRVASLDAVAAVFEYMQVPDSMVVWTGPSKSTRLIRCLLAHVSVVTSRVRWSGLHPLSTRASCFQFLCSGARKWCYKSVPQTTDQMLRFFAQRTASSSFFSLSFVH